MSQKKCLVSSDKTVPKGKKLISYFYFRTKMKQLHNYLCIHPRWDSDNLSLKCQDLRQVKFFPTLIRAINRVIAVAFITYCWILTPLESPPPNPKNKQTATDFLEKYFPPQKMYIYLQISSLIRPYLLKNMDSPALLVFLFS